MHNEYISLLDSLRQHFAATLYDPHRGLCCTGPRQRVSTPVEGLPWAYVPVEMLDNPAYATCRNNALAWKRLRCASDFEYWAANCVKIKPKRGFANVPFTLNIPQRHVLSIIERQRRAGEPLRLIILKSRQWGCSTLVQIYMAWIQTCLRKNWNSIICAHVKDTSATIRGMYTKLLANYPSEMWDGDEAPKFVPYEGSTNIRAIAGRDCFVAIGSSEKQDALRGTDVAMAHLSEIAFWPSSREHTPEAAVNSVCSGIARMPLTLVALESTANGVGNYFHSEWRRAVEGRSDKAPIFIPWFETGDNADGKIDVDAMAKSLTPYELRLWNEGALLAQIAWYRAKAREYSSPQGLNAEYPSDDVEAFAATTRTVFSPEHVEALRCGCMAPTIGDVGADGRFVPSSTGALSLWRMPQPGCRYVAAVDVGGRSADADWSVIAVFRADAGEMPEVVAQWRGHVDHDILVRKCAAVGRFYNTALLVIESNTFETAEYGGVENSNLFVLSRLAESYPAVYRRRSYDRAGIVKGSMIGFHTNRATKAILIDGLIEAVREGSYIEHSDEACNELLVYEQLPNGSFAARCGYHDDILMTRAMALHVISTDFRAFIVPRNIGKAR